MDLNLRQVKAFVTVARVGSFTRAAALLHVSQPALTVQVRKLEESLDTRLFDRTSRSVALTAMGRDLLPVLQRTIEDLDAVLLNARGISAGKRGVVRVAALPSFAASLLPAIILRFRRSNPALSFVVKDAIASRVNEMVRVEDVDIGVTGGDLSDTEIDVVHRGEDRLCLVYPANHPIARRRSVGIQDLIDVPLVLVASGTSVRATVDAAFARLGRHPVVACEATYMMTAVAMVRAGLGLSILPAAAREIRAEQGLRTRPIADSSFVRSVAFIKKKGRTLPPAAQSFLAACIAAMKEGLEERRHPGRRSNGAGS
jgi:DNA-binding transcriptional LysR family regulator